MTDTVTNVMPARVEFRAEILPDGRKRVTVFNTAWPENAYNPQSYTTVRNIDGSNRLMSDSGLWSFLPYHYQDAAELAIATAEGAEYPFAHCVPQHHVIVDA